MMLEIGGDGGRTARVVSYTFEDGLSALFGLRIRARIEGGEAAMSELVGRSARFRFEAFGELASVSGLVREVHASGGSGPESEYALEIVPTVWLATRRHQHRIFQGRSVPQIVRDVLAAYPTIAAPREALDESYPEREYVTQYGETDYDFIARLLADEGIATYFAHDDDSRLVLVDRTDVLSPEHAEPVPYLAQGGLAAAGPHVTHVTVAANVRAASTRYRDYDFERPTLRIEGHAASSGELFESEAELESHDFHVGAARDGQRAERRARHSLEAARGGGRRVELVGNFAIGAGVRLHVDGAGRPELDESLLVARVRISGLGDGLQSGASLAAAGSPRAGEATAHVVCAVASVPWRPARRPRPRVEGTHTAVVVPSALGEEIDVDVHGRVLVEFPWDRRAKGHASSRRVRVSQAWAGPGYGVVCIPRVGDEVVVTFLGNDPDEPLVIGRVYNGHNRAPLRLPEDKTRSIWQSRSSPGGGGENHILFEDRAGGELVEVRAERDYRRIVGADSVTRVAHDRSLDVRGDTRVTVGGSHHENVTGDMQLVVEGRRELRVTGDEAHTVLAKAELRVSGDQTVAVDGAASATVGGNHALEVRGDAMTSVHGNRGDSVDGDVVSDFAGTHTVVIGDKLRVSVGPVELTVSKDGTVSLSGAKRVELACDDELSIESDNKISVATQGSVSVNAAGRVVVRGGQVVVN